MCVKNTLLLCIFYAVVEKLCTQLLIFGMMLHVSMSILKLASCSGQCSRKRVQHFKKCKKSCFLDFQTHVKT